MRALGQLAARRADEVAIKEDLPFLRGRTRESAIGELREGIRAGGVNPSSVPVYELELDGLVGELTTPGRLAATDDGTPRVVMLMCHAERDEICALPRRRRVCRGPGRRHARGLSPEVRLRAAGGAPGPAKPIGSPVGIVARLELVAQLMDAPPELGQVVG